MTLTSDERSIRDLWLVPSANILQPGQGPDKSCLIKVNSAGWVTKTTDCGSITFAFLPGSACCCVYLFLVWSQRKGITATWHCSSWQKQQYLIEIHAHIWIFFLPQCHCFYGYMIVESIRVSCNMTGEPTLIKLVHWNNFLVIPSQKKMYNICKTHISHERSCLAWSPWLKLSS